MQMHAFIQNDRRLVEYINSASVEHLNRVVDGSAIIHQVAASGNTDMMRQLRVRNVNFFSQNNAGQTPFHIAAKQGHLRIVEYIWSITENKYQLDTTQALASAEANNHAHIVNCFAQVEKNTIISIKKRFETALVGKQYQEIRNLIKTHPQILDGFFKGYSPLFSVVNNGNIEIARILLEEVKATRSVEDYILQPNSVNAFNAIDIAKLHKVARYERFLIKNISSERQYDYIGKGYVARIKYQYHSHFDKMQEATESNAYFASGVLHSACVSGYESAPWLATGGFAFGAAFACNFSSNMALKAAPYITAVNEKYLPTNISTTINPVINGSFRALGWYYRLNHLWSSTAGTITSHIATEIASNYTSSPNALGLTCFWSDAGAAYAAREIQAYYNIPEITDFIKPLTLKSKTSVAVTIQIPIDVIKSYLFSKTQGMFHEDNIAKVCRNLDGDKFEIKNGVFSWELPVNIYPKKFHGALEQFEAIIKISFKVQSSDNALPTVKVLAKQIHQGRVRADVGNGIAAVNLGGEARQLAQAAVTKALGPLALNVQAEVNGLIASELKARQEAISSDYTFTNIDYETQSSFKRNPERLEIQIQASAEPTIELTQVQFTDMINLNLFNDGRKIEIVSGVYVTGVKNVNFNLNQSEFELKTKINADEFIIKATGKPTFSVNEGLKFEDLSLRELPPEFAYTNYLMTYFNGPFMTLLSEALRIKANETLNKLNVKDQVGELIKCEKGGVVPCADVKRLNIGINKIQVGDTLKVTFGAKAQVGTMFDRFIHAVTSLATPIPTGLKKPTTAPTLDSDHPCHYTPAYLTQHGRDDLALWCQNASTATTPSESAIHLRRAEVAAKYG